MADLQQRRRRLAAGEAAEEEALLQLEKELQEQEALPALNDETEIPDEGPEMREKTTVEDMIAVETPKALAPRASEAALFSPAQPATLEAQAAHLYGGPKVLQGIADGSQETVAPEVPRPKFLEDERAKEMALLSTATGSPSPMDLAAMMAKVDGGGPMMQMLLGLYQENQKLKEAMHGVGGDHALQAGAHGGGLPGTDLRRGYPGGAAGNVLHRGRAALADGGEGVRGRSGSRGGAGLPGGQGHSSMAQEMLTPHKGGGTEPEFETPEEDKPEHLGQEQRDLYALTPMQQFAKLQPMMDQATSEGRARPGDGHGGDRGRATRGTTSRERATGRSTSKDRTFRGIPTPKVGRTMEPTPQAAAGPGHAGAALPRMQEERMQHQMDIMMKMTTHLLEGKKGSPEEGMEQVRPGTTTLATLVEPGETAPIDYADWLTTIEPAMQDLSDASYIWWDHIMKVSQMWYQDYVKLRPLQRTTFEAAPDEELKKKKWVRVERRAVTMMMGAVP